MRREIRSCAAGLRAQESRRTAVERAEAYLKDHLDSPVPVSRLCDVAGLSERGLRNAFQSVRGMSPARCMRAERLQGAREALRGQWPGPITVTDVATGYGFYELGRFAVTYRTEFGESPSETLRRAGRPEAAEPSTEPKSSRRQ